MWTTTGERQQVSPSRTMVVFTDDYEHALMTWRTRTRRRRRLTAADSSPAVAGGRLTARRDYHLRGRTTSESAANHNSTTNASSDEPHGSAGSADPPRVSAHLQVLACVQDLGLCVHSHARCYLSACLHCQVCLQVCLHLSHLAL